MVKKELDSVDSYIFGKRLKHSLLVEEEIDRIISYKCEVYRKYLTDAARYHDIGYSGVIPSVIGQHNIDGYLFIKDKVHPLTSYLVLRHTGMKELAQGSSFESIYNRIEKNALIDVEVSGNIDLAKVEEMIDLLTLCDILVDFNGVKTTAVKRLSGVGLRKGIYSKEYKVMESEIKRLRL